MLELQVTDFTYSSGKPYVYKEGDQIPINFGLIPIDMFDSIFNLNTGETFSKRKPTLWSDIFLFRRDEYLEWIPFLRVFDPNKYNEGDFGSPYVYQMLYSLNGLT